MIVFAPGQAKREQLPQPAPTTPHPPDWPCVSFLTVTDWLRLTSTVFLQIGSTAVVNGLKRTKSLSHDGRVSVPATIGGEGLVRSTSNQGDSSDASSPAGGSYSIFFFYFAISLPPNRISSALVLALRWCILHR